MSAFVCGSPQLQLLVVKVMELDLLLLSLLVSCRAYPPLACLWPTSDLPHTMCIIASP
jgi:hypothetical protein